MEPIGCPETSVRNYNYKLSSSPEERSSQTQTDKETQKHTVNELNCRKGINKIKVTFFLSTTQIWPFQTAV
jgi:hypothetical protein